jgi:hypothetical protein
MIELFWYRLSVALDYEGPNVLAVRQRPSMNEASPYVEGLHQIFDNSISSYQ